MEIKRRINGKVIELDIRKVKNYRDYSLYGVYQNGVWLYNETFTDEQIVRIIENDGFLVEDRRSF